MAVISHAVHMVCEVLRLHGTTIQYRRIRKSLYIELHDHGNCRDTCISLLGTHQETIRKKEIDAD